MSPVVVCGAGPAGLVLALELAAWQVPVLLVERHRLPLPFPRGRAISTRSMEILRPLGLEREVTEIGLPRTETQHSSLVARSPQRSLAGSAARLPAPRPR